jgi:pSer/pThr/pTyr-binding forkhead associated (FHA) protein
MPPIIRDLGSTNGTAVDGRKIAEAPLHDGAQITIGNTVLTFRSG